MRLLIEGAFVERAGALALMEGRLAMGTKGTARDGEPVGSRDDKGRRRKAALLQALIAISAAALPMPVLAQQASVSQPVRFSIPAQPLPSAIEAFIRATGWQVGYATGVAGAKRSNAVSGTMPPRQALQAMLSGTGLQVRMTGAAIAAVVAPRADTTGAVEPADGAQVVLDPIDVQGRIETAWGPVEGYVATRSASGSKTDTPLIETPQSVSVVTADQIANQKAVSVAEALSYTPGITMQSQSFSRMVDDVNIRGFDAAGPSGNLLRDGMKYQSAVYDLATEPYGLERLDVLRGASSMLYGQLAPGGVINGISKRPTDTPLHEVNVEYGSYNRKQVSGDFGGPLNAGGTLLYRLTGLVRDADNWVNDTPDDKVYIAPALTFKPDDATQLTLLANYQHVKTRFSTPLMLEDISTGRIPRDLFLGEPDFDTYEGDSWSAGYLFDHEFDNGIKFHSKARYFASDVQWDYMIGNLAPVTDGQLYRLASVRDEKSSGLTADNSLEKTFEFGDWEHNVLAGFDYYRRGYDTHRYRGTDYIPLDVDNPVYSGAPVIDYSIDRGTDTTANNYGVYLQDQIKFREKWVFLFGGRYDRADSETTSYQSGDVTEQDDDAFTGRAGLVYLFDNGIAPYASVSQSFLPQAGVDSRTGDALVPTKGLQYEVGVRYQPADSNLLLSAAIYDLTQTDLVSYDPITFLPYQVGKVRSRGLELEARGQFDELGLVAAYAYTDTRILESAVPTEIGQQEELTPRNMFSIWADYRMDTLGLTGLTLGGGLRYIGKTNLLDSAEDVPGYLLADAMVKYDFGAVDPKFEGTTLNVNARNLFDKQYYTCAGATGCRYGEPLTVTATLSRKW
ncbi:iron complex outermembrane receptor protein [Mesorhizobium robiniae]|uniref:Iron complex outermembrane receptor protein n=1 Tax=Mesorhizobium robiniae TaxID=559315 RepID=A0ABV2GRT1_9HYPH